MSGMLPTDVAQQALDAAGIEYELGDIEDGTGPARRLLRAYPRCLRQMLRAAHWDFARATAPLVLLADSSGQTPNVGSIVPVPWYYSYQYPIDCAKVRFVPWNINSLTAPIPPGNIQIQPTPLVTGLGQNPQTGQRIKPARFTIATDANYIPPPGSISWEVQGVSPQGRTVVLTNVQNAQVVYTRMMLYPSVWDESFRAAFVAYLASEIVLPLSKDKKMGMALRADQIKIAKDKIAQARISDGNEGWYSSDIQVDWMRFRNAGSGGPWSGVGQWGGEGPGVCGYGWDACGFSDGSAY